MHKNLDAYLGAEKPEEKTLVEVIDDPFQNVTHAYLLWNESVKKSPTIEKLSFSLCDGYDVLLQEAEKIISGHNLPEKMKASCLSPHLRESIPHIGLFYTALLNAGVKKVVVPVLDHPYPPGGGYGYKLQRGILEICAEIHTPVGSFARGGCIINRYYHHLENVGRMAAGGIFINYDKCYLMGQYATGGIFINLGNVTRFEGKSTFIDYGEDKIRIRIPNNVGLFELRVIEGNTTTLGRLLGKLKNSVNKNDIEERDVDTITKTVNKIEQHLEEICTKL